MTESNLSAAPRRRGGRVYSGTARGLRTLALLAAVTLGGCNLFGGGGGGSNKIHQGPFTTTSELYLGSATFSAQILSADIPEKSQSVGIVSIGTNSNYKVVDHGYFLADSNGNSVYIRDPNGKKAPLSFNQINGADYPYNLPNVQASALFFPNNGDSKTLAAGTWTFPVASYDANGSGLQSDTMTTFVYYKTVTTSQPTLKLNVFVLDGVTTNITNTTQANTDPEMQGAVAVLDNVYRDNASTGLNVQISVQFLDDSANAACLNGDGRTSTYTEAYCLQSSYPTAPTHDAMNIFIVYSLDHVDSNNPGSGVIGLAAGIPGPFNRQGTDISGTLAEYQGDGTGTILGFTLAHEFGHFLGLFHTSQTDSTASSIIGEDPISDTKVCKNSQVSDSIDKCPDRDNLMFPYVSTNTNPDVSIGQGNVVRYNPGVTLR